MTEKHKERILAVDDSLITLEVLQRNLVASGYEVLTCSDVHQSVTLLEQASYDLVITDLKMPGISGLDLVRHVRHNHRETEIMMITGYPSLDGAVEAVKAGAEQYLAKPFTDEELLTAVRKVLDKLQAKRVSSQSPSDVSMAQYGIIGSCAAMGKVFGAIEKASASSATVLITGESGTGKELVARAIHYSGARASAPFVPVNCGSIPEGLLESELFGHVKGAFTGAAESRAGFFHSADGGTIFLDEISETSPSMQVSLLRVLQDKEVRMVGSSKARRVDVRVVAATNHDLLSLVKRGKFREDLFYRLNVIAISVPALRDRGEDGVVLARHFAAKYATDYEKQPPEFSAQALDAMRHYEWPGNVRELENLIQHLVVMMEGTTVEVSDLPSLMRFSVPKSLGVHRTLAEVEAEHIRNVLASVDSNISRAASILGVDRKTLRSKIR